MCVRPIFPIVPLLFLSFSSFIFIILFALSHFVSNIRLFLFKTQRSFYLLFLFAFCVAFRDFLHLIFPSNLWVGVINAPILLTFLLFLSFHSTIFTI